MGTMISILIAFSTLFTIQSVDSNGITVSPLQDMKAGQEITIPFEDLSLGYIDENNDGICDNFGQNPGKGLGLGNGWKNSA